MSFPRYPAYKDSGVEWLGDVPEHWDVRRLKRNLPLLTEKAEQRDFAVALENIEGWTGRFVETDAELAGEGVAFDAGDILFGKLRPYLAKAWVADRRGEAVGDFHVLHPTEDVFGRFSLYQILTAEFISIVDGSTFGAKMPRVGWDFLSTLPLATPPFTEQISISAFLDRETAKIDTLVADYRTLIELLQEKRQAVISHAVTKGLDPIVPMKDSGVEWLGEVPEHWQLLSMKQIIVKLDQGWSPQCESFPVENECDWAVLKVGCVNGGRFSPIDNKALPDSLDPQPELAVTAGDILISRANTRELVGSAALIDRAYEKLMISDKLYRVRVDLRKCLPEFISYFLGSDSARQVIQLEATGASSSMLNISQATVRELHLSIPGLVEQKEICQFIDTQTDRLDSLISDAQEAITLLQERRTALISAAVTGKIDVRGLVEPEAA